MTQCLIPKAVLIYDFDGTLSPGNMQEFGFIKAINSDPDSFWRQCRELSLSQDASGILSYMFLMLKCARQHDISLRRESFKAFGAEVELFPGVEQWFARVNAYGRKLGLEVHHFIVSSGLEEMIEGTPIFRHFDRVFASRFLYDKAGNAYWPAAAVDFTAKTQYIFKINKGINTVQDDRRINAFIPKEYRPMPFSGMIYFGDGATDIPSMKMVRTHGGHSIAVYDPRHPEKAGQAWQLLREDRAHFACRADFTAGSELDQVVRRIMHKIRADEDFAALRRRYQAQAEQWPWSSD